MKEQLISFETAKLTKEKGFNLLTHSYYFEDSEFREHSLKGTNGYYGEEYEFDLSEFNENWNDKWLTKKTGNKCFGCSKQQGYLETFSAPTQSLLQRWLREIHNIHLNVEYYPDRETKNYCITGDYKTLNQWTWIDHENDIDFDTYEEALELGLSKGLKLIK